MRIAVTGGCGFIGVHLVRRLLERSHQVLVIDDHRIGGPDRLEEHPGLKIAQSDVTHGPELYGVLKEFAPDAVFHLAALHFVPYCERHPLETFQVNVQGTQALLEAMSKLQIQRLYYASSAAVYPDNQGPCSEESGAAPMDIYGFSKWMAELLVSAQPDLPATIYRLFNVYGPEETQAHLIPHILAQLKHGRQISIGNLKPRRDFVYIADTIEAFMLGLDSPMAGTRIFNVGTGSAHSAREILDVLEIFLGGEFDIRSRRELVRSVDRPVLIADSSKISKQFGWRPKYSLREGLGELLKHDGILPLAK